MGNELIYDIGMLIPLNFQTTKLYSDDEELLAANVSDAMSKIESIIKRDTFISMERIFRILEMRSQIECPHILFDYLNVNDFFITNCGTEEKPDLALSLSLSYSFELTTFNIYTNNPPTKKIAKMSIVHLKKSQHADEVNENRGEPENQEEPKDEEQK